MTWVMVALLVLDLATSIVQARAWLFLLFLLAVAGGARLMSRSGDWLNKRIF